MKTAGAIYRKLKEVKFHHLISLYRKYLKKTPENCKYNYTYTFRGDDGENYQIRLCLLHQENLRPTGTHQLSGVIPHLLDVCQALDDCQNCNAYVGRYGRDEVKEIFEKELSVKSIRETKYPEICALEWVLERSAVGITPMSKFQALIHEIKKILRLKNRSDA